jgi:hypothetical protein
MAVQGDSRGHKGDTDMASWGSDAVPGSIYRWQQDTNTVELVHREGVTWLHATDDDGDVVVIELPPRVVVELRDALGAVAG